MKEDQREAILLESFNELRDASSIGSQYWQGYYDFWDDFLRRWFESGAKPEDEITRYYDCCVSGLNLDELPEPYLGKPHDDVDAVIINLNPGMSQVDERHNSIERQKFYSLRDRYRGNGPFVKTSLIMEFADGCNKRYSRFVNKWSCLDPKFRQRNTDLCGVKWWQGNNPKRIGGKRIPWLSRIYQTSIVPDKVFALELCPYHSKGFSFNGCDRDAKEKLVAFITNRVIRPAATAVVESGLPFAVAVGKGVADVLEGAGVHYSNEWKLETTKNERTYRQYIVNADNGQRANLIVTWLRNNRGIPAPGQMFEGLEDRIRGEVATATKF